jgi:hypothetical protein
MFPVVKVNTIKTNKTKQKEEEGEKMKEKGRLHK